MSNGEWLDKLWIGMEQERNSFGQIGVLSCHLPGMTEESQRKPQLVQVLPHPRLKPGTSQIQVWCYCYMNMLGTMQPKGKQQTSKMKLRWINDKIRRIKDSQIFWNKKYQPYHVISDVTLLTWDFSLYVMSAHTFLLLCVSLYETIY